MLLSLIDLNATNYFLNCVQSYRYLILFGVFCLYVVLVRYRAGLRDIPGPWFASVSSIWRFAVVWKQDMPATSVRLHEEYGPLVRIGPHHVSVADPEALKVIYGADGRYHKTAFYQTAQARYEGDVLPNMFSASGGEYHARIRRVTGHVYSMTAITELEPHVDSCVRLFLSKPKETSASGTPFDIDAWLQYYSFDCLGALSFSQDIGFLSSGCDVGSMIHAVDTIFDYVALVGQIPILDKFLLGNPLLGIFKPEKQKSGGILNFAIEQVHSRQEKQFGPKDILSRLFDIHVSDPQKLSFREIVGATSINVFAGHDALAISMRTILYYLCRNPKSYAKVTQEIRHADADGLLSSTATYLQAASLPYLSAVINEAFRIHPPVGLILERHVPAGGDTICGLHLPQGTVVGINAWVLHRNKDVFGDDIDDFRPERWIESDVNQLKEMWRNLFTFGAGARACIGRNIAHFEIFKLVLEICRNFDFRLADPGCEWHFQGSWVTKQTGMDMVFSEIDRSRQTFT